jgi:hypothetical protein
MVRRQPAVCHRTVGVVVRCVTISIVARLVVCGFMLAALGIQNLAWLERDSGSHYEG